ncbi:MAG: hypothetical protein HQK83_19620 [Fibrobacteria bacterium]|nr:hypothetical protein [Fibrobacteria bacterium]
MSFSVNIYGLATADNHSAEELSALTNTLIEKIKAGGQAIATAATEEFTAVKKRLELNRKKARHEELVRELGEKFLAHYQKNKASIRKKELKECADTTLANLKECESLAVELNENENDTNRVPAIWSAYL